MKILIVAPHPDDEVLGCGGIMKRMSNEGNHVYVLVVSKGSPKFYSDDKIDKVRGEALNAHKILGVKETFFFDFHAPFLDVVPVAEISNAINKLIKDLGIEELYLPHRGDIHNDHRQVFYAGLVAARPVGDYTVKNIYVYETLSETEWAPPFGDDAFIPTRFVNIEDYIDCKTEAMNCFKSQIKEFPNSRSIETIESLSKLRGSAVGFKAAEAFMVIRTIL